VDDLRGVERQLQGDYPPEEWPMVCALDAEVPQQGAAISRAGTGGPFQFATQQGPPAVTTPAIFATAQLKKLCASLTPPAHARSTKYRDAQQEEGGRFGYLGRFRIGRIDRVDRVDGVREHRGAVRISV
jgi:hypothetical protein